MLRRTSRWLLGHVFSPHDREEQGYPPSGFDSNITDNRKSKPLTVITTDDNALIPPNDKLLIYRALTGIDTVPALTSSGHANRAAPNVGIYQRVVLAERSAARGYRIFNIFVNGCLGTQVVVASTLTALGAANGSRVAVTGFGAINTIIAGILTYLKGSGLPNRLRCIENQFKVVREYIEQREREFCLADCSLDPHNEVQIVEEMYKAAKQDMNGNKNSGIQNSGANSIPRIDSSALQPVTQRISKLTEPLTSMRHGVPAPEKKLGGMEGM